MVSDPRISLGAFERGSLGDQKKKGSGTEYPPLVSHFCCSYRRVLCILSHYMLRLYLLYTGEFHSGPDAVSLCPIKMV